MRNVSNLWAGSIMTDREFLLWLADRLEYVYDESPNTDFVLRLRDIAEKS